MPASELQQLAETIYKRSVEQKIRRHQQVRREIDLRKAGMSAMLRAVSKPSSKLKLKYAFMLFKMMAFELAPQEQDSLADSGQQRRYGQTVSQLSCESDWYSVFWQKKKVRLHADQFKYKTGEQLFKIATQLEAEAEDFWKFRASNSLAQMNLHFKRRHRMVAAFAFQRYKVQSMRATIQQLVKAKVQTTSIGMLENNHTSGSKQLQFGPPESSHYASPSVVMVDTTSAGIDSEAQRKLTALHVLTMASAKAARMRQKARAFRLWQEMISEQESLALQVELYRLSNQVNQLKQEERAMCDKFT